MAFQKLSFKIILVFAFFLYPVILGNMALVCYAFVYGIPCLYIFLNYRKVVNYLRHLPFSIFIISISLLGLLVTSFSLPILYGTYDLSYVGVIGAVFRRLLIYIFLFVVIFNYYRDNLVVERFMFYHVIATTLYVIGTIIFLLLPDLRTTWTSVLQIQGMQAELIEGISYITRFGWSGFSGFRTTISCSLSIIFVTYLYANKENYFQLPATWYCFFSFFCFLGNMFYGRSGLVVSFLCVLSGLIIYHKISLKFLTGCCFVVILLAICVINLKAFSTALENWYVWLIIPFENLLETGSFNNQSLNHLIEDMYFMPDIDTLLLGDARYMEDGTGLYYMHTDAGLMRQILFWGVFFTGLIYLLCITLLFLLKFDYGLKVMFLIFFIVFEFKGECYFHLLPLFITLFAIGKLREQHYLKEINKNLENDF